MTWVVKRQKPDAVATSGELLIDGQHECYTLEPATPIDAGTYDLTIDWSNRFQRRMPHVNNVPGHTGIRIHWGNWSRDTKDCTLVGQTKGTDFVGHSVDEFNILFQKLDTALQEGPQLISYVDMDPFGSNGSGTGGSDA